MILGRRVIRSATGRFGVNCSIRQRSAIEIAGRFNIISRRILGTRFVVVKSDSVPSVPTTMLSEASMGGEDLAAAACRHGGMDEDRNQ